MPFCAGCTDRRKSLKRRRLTPGEGVRACREARVFGARTAPCMPHPAPDRRQNAASLADCVPHVVVPSKSDMRYTFGLAYFPYRRCAMGFRFQRRLRIAPGLRVNVSKSGLGLSLGPRGSSLSVGPRGAYSNVGIPGTGIAFRQKLGSAPPRRSGTRTEVLTAEIDFDPDSGKLVLRRPDGTALTSREERALRSQNRDEILQLAQERCAEINRELDGHLAVYRKTPSPRRKETFQRIPFDQEEPSPDRVTILDRLMRSRRERKERDYRERLERWSEAKAEHEKHEDRREYLFATGRFQDVDAMAEYLESRLAGIEWPGETIVNFDLENAGRVAMFDIDLPEIENFPRKRAGIAASGWKLNYKKLSDKQLRDAYASHIHGIAFRVVGETFLALPKSECVLVSGYSQRLDSATGQTRDEYLYSVIVERAAWEEIAFDHLADLEPVAAFERFHLRRSMKRGYLEPIEPFAADDALDKACGET